MWATLVTLFSRLGFAWARRRLDSEAQAELDAHLDLLVERYIRSGMTPEEARAAARRQLGNLTLAREEVYTAERHRDGSTRWRRISGTRSGQLRRSPGFSAVVIATLAVGIGGTTAVFSVLQAVLLAPLPVRAAGPTRALLPAGARQTRHATLPHWCALSRRFVTRGFVRGRHGACQLPRDGARPRQGRARSAPARAARHERLLPCTLRSGSLRGPGFERRDEAGTRRVVLSDRAMAFGFGGDPSIVGSTIQLSGEPYEVVGIAAARLRRSDRRRRGRVGPLRARARHRSPRTTR